MTPREPAALEPIAIIGIGCRFPGGIEDPRSFWDVIAAGTDAIVDIPPDRWDAKAFFDADPATPGRTVVRQGGFLRSPVDRFDAGFFGMPPREAAALDPQQRLLLEVTWEAFEDAGLPPSTTAATQVGCYIGGFTFDAATHQLSEANRGLVGPATPTGVSMTMLAARLSYVFDWRGPSLTMDTACSSSLVALHHACAALSRGECDLAVAGGVNVMVNPVTTILMSKGQFLSPDARCKSFDHRANGYARGEGAGIVLLKPLAAAQRDGDHIHAVVRGTAVNQDGRTAGITVPSREAQGALIRQACRSGGVEPTSVGYFEAHGTGTAVGDPIEANAIGDVLAGSDVTHLIGSVKSNIGHTEAAAGVAGVIKASLCLGRGLVPPNLHFERPNPKIPFDLLPLRVPTTTLPFPELAGPRRAAVNSFGFGGTNAHAILEQADHVEPADAQSDDGSPQLLVLSARSPEALGALAEAYAARLEQPGAPALRRVCRSAARQREQHPLRTFVVAASAAQAAAELRQSARSPRRPAPGGVAFVYTGMGPQWWGMGRELLREEPRFQEVVAACDKVLAEFDLSIADELLREEAESRLTETLYAQVANFVVQAGLTACLRGWGIEPAAIVGHSVGEVAAAYAAGVYTLEDALTISFHRASLQARLAGHGEMAAVDLPPEAVRPYLVSGVCVAAINSTHATTLAGDAEAMELVTRKLQESGASVKPLRVEVAYHSHQMDEIREPLLEALRGIRPGAAKTPLYSSVTGDRVDGSELDAGYWWQNVRQPVLFAEAMRQLLTCAPRSVMEIGPHPVLASAIDEALTEAMTGQSGDAGHIAVLRRDLPQRQQLLTALGALYVAGADPDWERVFPGPREYLDLPRYPWQRERHWTESAASREARLGVGGLRLGGRAVAATSSVRDVELSGAEFPYLDDHRIGETLVFPGSGYVEAALALFPEETPCFLQDIVFHRPLTLSARSITTLRAGDDPQQRLVTLHSRDQEAWTLHAQLRHPDIGRLRPPPPRATTLAELTRALPSLGHDEVYGRLDRSNLHYGPAFRAVERLWHRAETGEVFAELRVDTVDTEGYRLHPALLDAALQAMIAGALGLEGDVPAATYVPARIAELRYYRSPGKRLWLHGRDRRSTVAGRLECDLTLLTDEGEIAAEVLGLRAQLLPDEHTEEGTAPEHLYYEHLWRPASLGEASGAAAGGEAGDGADGGWAVVGRSATAAGLVRELEARGGTVLHTGPTEEGWLDHVLNAVHGSPACRGVVYLDETRSPQYSGAPACAPVGPLLQLVQALTGATVPLAAVTFGAQSVAADNATTDPFAAALWGFGRVIDAERPELRCRRIDLDPRDDIHRMVRALVGELCQDGLDEVALRGDTRYVRSLELAGVRSALREVPTRTDRTPVRLRADASGVAGLGFDATTRRAPGPTEVEIEVACVGVNFKDALKVTGLLSPEGLEGSYSQQTLGLECSGTVLRVGGAVADLRPGDEVFAHSRDLFSSHVTLDQVRVVRKPAALTLAQAASLLPVVTAHQSLVRLAGVRSGERVLVHSAAGGVGLAAVRLAVRLGAEVYATAGTEERREFLRGEGVAGVADSRSTAFADDIRRWTGGAGVDVVVNSLPGEILHQSLCLLRPFGRFVELGKADIAADHALRLAPFHRALSFHAFDYDQMMLLEPALVQQCMREAAELFGQDGIAPLPVVELPAAEVDAAFRAMTRREHIGKIVIRMDRQPVTVPASSIPDSPIRPDASYLITGGLGGLGLTVARRLADRGARHLVLLGRSGPASEDARQAVDQLTAQGVEVRIEQADVVDRHAVREVLARVRTHLPPLRGIVHAAADFDDVVLSDTDQARLLAATAPKADGAWNLHLETAADDLDFFLLFSSVAAQLGAAAAGAYATANEFLNGLARYRHARGLPATSVGWGMIDAVGVAVSRNGTVGAILRRNGHHGIQPAQLADELETLLLTAPVEASVADIDWRRWAQANPQLARLPRFATLVPAGALGDSGEASLPQRLRDASAQERGNVLPALVAPLMQRVTGLSEEQLADQQSVDIDSLTGVELRVLLQNTLGISVPAVRLQRNLTVTGLVGLLVEELDRAPGEIFRPLDALAVHSFPSSDGLVVHGHLSLPAGPGPHPAVLVCTSGAGGALDAEGRYAQVSEHAPLNAAGFAVFTVDLRGALGHGEQHAARVELGGADIDDILAAARHLGELPEIDASRLSIMGTSRGAYAALLALAREPAGWHRGILVMGLYDPALLVAAEHATPGALLPQHPDVTPSDIADYFDDPRRQPLTMLAQVTAPLLLVHGDADETVPPDQSQQVADRAERQGLPARLVTVPGMGHDNHYADAAWAELWPQISTFLGAEPNG